MASKSETSTKRRSCKGKNKAGKPCGAAPLKGKDYCSAHDPVSPGFGTESQARSAGQLGGRPRLKRPSEIAQQLIEDNELVIQRPYWRALGYDVVKGDDGRFRLVEREGGGVKLHSTWEGLVHVSDHDDIGGMQAAADKLQDRAYGKPKQQTEVTGADGGPIETESREVQADLSKLTVAERETFLELSRKVGA